MKIESNIQAKDVLKQLYSLKNQHQSISINDISADVSLSVKQEMVDKAKIKLSSHMRDLIEHYNRKFKNEATLCPVCNEIKDIEVNPWENSPNQNMDEICGVAVRPHRVGCTMVKKVNFKNHNEFYGCSGHKYNGCLHTISIRKQRHESYDSLSATMENFRFEHDAEFGSND